MDRHPSRLARRQVVQILRASAHSARGICSGRRDPLSVRAAAVSACSVSRTCPIRPRSTRVRRPNLLAAHVHLHDFRILRIELLIREIGAEHQQGIAVHHRVIAGRKAQQPRHADVVRVVVLDEFLPRIACTIGRSGVRRRRSARRGRRRSRRRRESPPSRAAFRIAAAFSQGIAPAARVIDAA